MKYHILFVEPQTPGKTKPQTVIDFVDLLLENVKNAGGKVYVNHNVVMLGDYDATILCIIDYGGKLPVTNNEVKVTTASFKTEDELLAHRIMKTIKVLKREYIKNKNILCCI